VDATGWQLGFDGAHIQTSNAGLVGPSLAALEAAKHLFFTAAAEKDLTEPTAYPWPSTAFDAWLWRWSTEAVGEIHVSDVPADSKIVLVGCGGVGAAYLWFLKKSGMKGKILLIDDGSSDDSLSIAQSLCAQRPERMVCLQQPDGKRKGTSAARNLGLAQVRHQRHNVIQPIIDKTHDAAREAAIAAPLVGAGLLQHQHLRPGFARRQGRRQGGIACPHDHNIAKQFRLFHAFPP